MIFWLKKDLSSSEICLSSGNNAPSSWSHFSPSKKLREVPSACWPTISPQPCPLNGNACGHNPAAHLYLIQDRSLHTYFYWHTAQSVWVCLSSEEITSHLCQLTSSNLTKKFSVLSFILLPSFNTWVSEICIISPHPVYKAAFLFIRSNYCQIIVNLFITRPGTITHSCHDESVFNFLILPSSKQMITEFEWLHLHEVSHEFNCILRLFSLTCFAKSLPTLLYLREGKKVITLKNGKRSLFWYQYVKTLYQQIVGPLLSFPACLLVPIIRNIKVNYSLLKTVLLSSSTKDPNKHSGEAKGGGGCRHIQEGNTEEDLFPVEVGRLGTMLKMCIPKQNVVCIWKTRNNCCICWKLFIEQQQKKTQTSRTSIVWWSQLLGK